MELPALKGTRLRAGLSQRDLATKAGLTQRTIVKLEGGTPARPSTARKLAQALDVRIDFLAGQGRIGTGGQQGSPVYVLEQGEPGDADARWLQIGGGSGDGEGGGQ